MESERYGEDGNSNSNPPPAEVDMAFTAIPAEARAALWLLLVDGARMSDVAEVIGISEEGAALIAAGGAAQVLERLRRAWLGGSR